MIYSQMYPQLFGLEPKEAEPEPSSASPEAPVASAALTLINKAESPDELTPIPTVGKGSAKQILDARPENGYESLEALPAKIFAPPFNCDLGQIKAYALDE